MAQPKHTTSWFLDVATMAGRRAPVGRHSGTTGRDLSVQGAGPLHKPNATKHQPACPEITAKPGVAIGGQPLAFSKTIGKLLSDGSRKAVDRLHDKGITTYGWKDDQVVAVKPRKT